MNKTHFKEPYQLIAEHWNNEFKKKLNGELYFLIREEFDIKKTNDNRDDVSYLKYFLEKNAGNTQEAFNERIMKNPDIKIMIKETKRNDRPN